MLAVLQCQMGEFIAREQADVSAGKNSTTARYFLYRVTVSCTTTRYYIASQYRILKALDNNAALCD